MGGYGPQILELHVGSGWVYRAGLLGIPAHATGSGLVLWRAPGASLAAQDAFLHVHVVVSWVLLVAIPVHLTLARAKIVARTREIRGIDRPAPPS